jgi:hypothetical protein
MVTLAALLFAVSSLITREVVLNVKNRMRGSAAFLKSTLADFTLSHTGVESVSLVRLIVLLILFPPPSSTNREQGIHTGKDWL